MSWIPLSHEMWRCGVAARTDVQKQDALVDYAALESGSFVFDPDLPISKHSVFGDESWNWSDTNNPRLNTTQASKLRINWKEMTADIPARNFRRACKGKYQSFAPILPPEMVEDLKRAFFILAFFPSVLRGKRRRQNKPITTVYAIKHTANFLSHAFLKSLEANAHSQLQTLGDITLSQVQAAIATYPYSCHPVKGVLMMLAEENIQKNLKHGRLQWGTIDIKHLRWPPKKEIEGIETLPDQLFAFLSNKSSELVSEFLRLLGRTPKDPVLAEQQRASTIRNWPLFKEMFESYICRRDVIRMSGAAAASVHTYKFVKRFSIFPKALWEFLFDVHCAAQTLVLLYTGMRFSETCGIRVGCLIQRSGVTLMKSSVIKHTASNMPIDEDEWIAIDAVEDAVLALEELSRCNFNPFLFSNFETVKNGKRPRPLSNGGLTSRLNHYLVRIDTKGDWSNWQLSPHQYRHGLINQLARAEVGIPYITRQLKHYYSTVLERTFRIAPTSTIYGKQAQMLVANATGLHALKRAKLEIARDLYAEGGVFAGGGAKLHVERTEGFFRGIGLEGKAREQYIEKLAETGGGPIRTGVGFCMRNHVDPRKLKEAPPPCIGDLNCNPHTCVYSVVPESRKSEVIARYRNAAKQLVAPDQSHLTSHWQKELDAYSAMLQQLGIDPHHLPSSTINPDTVARVLAGN